MTPAPAVLLSQKETFFAKALRSSARPATPIQPVRTRHAAQLRCALSTRPRDHRRGSTPPGAAAGADGGHAAKGMRTGRS